ncbi:GNAT family N-acetyltransferase [Streptomyces armeniacus]|uniref:GNAT family N-acetyltransferase n=1 Tax=Streptomyces armeniacus TaxID=83291 RepID=A0A345XK54_9ACTN|nr:GNAT family N-acetyltransferase [Streptomyces armeniacus]AXK32020.1 GNAT family N-acetyltransferase [Streptomyces armeniacus]
MEIRPARAAELEVLREIERTAGQWFRDVGMDLIADHEPPSPAELRQLQQAGRLWVSAGEDDRPVAYAVLLPVDGCTHVEQISVHAGSARRGIGRALLDDVAERERAAGVPALTLTTFDDVPWNAPYYERCGFRRLADGELTPGLREIRAHEAELGIDRWPRVCMRRELV